MKIYLFMLSCIGMSCFAVSSLLAQSAPGWSRGQQTLSISYDESVRRSPLALQAEGFRIDYSGGSFSVGIKGVHTAIIMCTPSADGKLTVNIVVASNGEGGEAERKRLHARMDNPGAPPTAGPTSAGPAGTKAADWNAQADGLRGKNNQRFSFSCPSGSPSSRLWGTDVYTDDSSVCTAAVHAGLITYAGGSVTIEIRPGQASYSGSTRNGVNSGNYGGYSGSFVFVR